MGLFSKLANEGCEARDVDWVEELKGSGDPKSARNSFESRSGVNMFSLEFVTEVCKRRKKYTYMTTKIIEHGRFHEYKGHISWFTKW